LLGPKYDKAVGVFEESRQASDATALHLGVTLVDAKPIEKQPFPWYDTPDDFLPEEQHRQCDEQANYLRETAESQVKHNTVEVLLINASKPR
jgi:hypothetical protein